MHVGHYTDRYAYMRHPPPTDADVSYHIALLRLHNMDSWKMVCRMHSPVSNSASVMEHVPGVVSVVHMNWMRQVFSTEEWSLCSLQAQGKQAMQRQVTKKVTDSCPKHKSNLAGALRTVAQHASLFKNVERLDKQQSEAYLHAWHNGTTRKPV